MKVDRDGNIRCRVCACTEREPCSPACGWSGDEVDLCTTCADAVTGYVAWLIQTRRPNRAAFLREVSRALELIRVATKSQRAIAAVLGSSAPKASGNGGGREPRIAPWRING